MSPFIFLQCTTFLFLVTSTLANGEGVFDKIKAGLQNARNYLETARDIADLVSASLRRTREEGERVRGDDADYVPNRQGGSKPLELTSLVNTFFRLLGLDAKKITAVTVNSFIFFAQMISELFKVNPAIRDNFKATDERESLLRPMKLIKESKNYKVQSLWQRAQDEDLPNQLMDLADYGSSPCTKLLLCKASPVIWAAQESLKNGSISGPRALTSWLPSKDKFEENSDACDDKHSGCPVNFNT